MQRTELLKQTVHGSLISTDALGNVYVAGGTKGSLGGDNAGLRDAFVSKYDASGTLLWTEQWGTEDWDEAFDVSPDGLGNIYVSGNAGGNLAAPNVNDYGAFLSKIDASGTPLWSEQWESHQIYDQAWVAADSLGNVYVAETLLIDAGPDLVRLRRGLYVWESGGR